MKSFCFREILIASQSERKARRIAFHPKVTLIRGENETGKSSLLKTIFRTFGAEPTKVHPSWQAANPRSLVRFDVNGISFAILRHRESFAVFDAKGSLLKRFHKVTSGLGPYVASLVGFGLRLPDRTGKFVVLPPAYYFLPFYMDQDGSWTRQWAGFARLEQFANWRKGVVEYHAGIRGNEYYETQAVKFEAEAEAADAMRRREGLEAVYGSLGKRFEAAQFDVDFSAYQGEVGDLLNQCNRLRDREETFKARLSELQNHRQSLVTQLAITLNAREEAAKDYSFVQEHGDDVQCPTCGAAYDNSFTERFSIAMDEDHCAGLIVRLEEEIREVDRRIEGVLESAKTVSEEIIAIERLLARKEGEIALGDLIRQEGRRELRDVMRSDLSALETREGEAHVKAKDAEKRMKRFDGKERRKEVNTYFADTMAAFLGRLDVLSVQDAFPSVDSTYQGTGSELPRALLAYKLGFLRVAEKFSSVVPAPLVIDSPNQQDQDHSHLESLLKFIRDQRPDNTQLVLGLVGSAGVDFGGSEIVLDRDRSLLIGEEFDSVSEEIQRYVDVALEAEPSAE